MQRSYVPFLIAAAALLACGENQSPTQIAAGAAQSESRDTVLRGTIIPNPGGRKTPSALVLLEEDGTVVGLSGDQTDLLASVVDAQVEARGRIEDWPQLLVQSFVVLAVKGQPVSDGVLELSDTGYGLRLTAGGYRDLIGPPAELMTHVGERLWVTGPDDGPPTDFGVIAIITKSGGG